MKYFSNIKTLVISLILVLMMFSIFHLQKTIAIHMQIIKNILTCLEFNNKINKYQIEIDSKQNDMILDLYERLEQNEREI